MKVTRRMREGIKTLRNAICFGEEEAVCRAIRILHPEFEERTDVDIDELVNAMRMVLMETLEEIHEAFQDVTE